MRSSSHTIDISVVTFNSEKWIQPFVDSLVSQALPLSRVSLLLRDNGSRDNTVKLLRQIREKLIGQFSRIEIEEGDNVGFGRGHNANLTKVGSEYFLVTNVDLEFEANTLTTLLDTAVADAAEVALGNAGKSLLNTQKTITPSPATRNGAPVPVYCCERPLSEPWAVMSLGSSCMEKTSNCLIACVTMAIACGTYRRPLSGTIRMRKQRK